MVIIWQSISNKLILLNQQSLPGFAKMLQPGLVFHVATKR